MPLHLIVALPVEVGKIVIRICMGKRVAIATATLSPSRASFTPATPSVPVILGPSLGRVLARRLVLQPQIHPRPIVFAQCRRTPLPAIIPKLLAEHCRPPTIMRATRRWARGVIPLGRVEIGIGYGKVRRFRRFCRFVPMRDRGLPANEPCVRFIPSLEETDPSGPGRQWPGLEQVRAGYGVRVMNNETLVLEQVPEEPRNSNAAEGSSMG